MMTESPGEEHLLFTQWALSQGVKINGVAPAKYPGRGLGMIATKVIEVRPLVHTLFVAQQSKI
jgi:hypothetical protein